MNEKKLVELCKEIYRQMYEEAEPSANFDELMDKGVTTGPDWFMGYFLEPERQQEIIEEHCDNHKLSQRERDIVELNILLGAAPNSSRKTWQKKRENARA